jgi:hypothetical protein
MKNKMKQLILDFINSEETELKLDFLPLNDYAKILSELGFNTILNGSLNLMNDNADYDTNGWQVDFWWNFKLVDKKYCLGGSLFYGDFTLSKED